MSCISNLGIESFLHPFSIHIQMRDEDIFSSISDMFIHGDSLLKCTSKS